MDVENSKSWIIKNKNGIKVFICPYCEVKCDAPYEKCGSCGKPVSVPTETGPVVKKGWW